MQRIGEKIKILRESDPNPLSQEELARSAGVSQTTIADLERGRNETSRRLTNIAQALGVSAEQLESLTAEQLLRNKQEKNAQAPALTLADDEASLTRKALQPSRNINASKALFDLAKELERGDLPPEVQSMLTQEFEAKAKFVRASLDRINKGDKEQ